MKKIMMINDLCDNCGVCIRACMKKHKVSRIAIMEKNKKYLPIVCQHCTSAPCKDVCPVGAIYFKNGYVYLDENICIGCGLCALACPFGAIVMEDKAYKCILCDGEEPVCVKACPKKCLDVVDVNELTFKKREKVLPIFEKIKLDGNKPSDVIDKIITPAKINL
ncbi:4Fe-4S dicluster domain-containing protein [Methanocaldococcus indicus]|uniref:4Fe-4S dicluster domain-containing protein n=1 Tax=Methanocaldococcus indicus TaxID=213231 RepID=UPI003C6D78CD